MPILQDKVALVTGAGAGIGRAIALAMAEAGATIAAADIDPAAAQRTADQAASNTRRALAVEVDCGEVAQIDAMVARTIAELGRLDIIVNNAGVTRYAYITDLTEADWDRIHRVNAKGVFFCLQRAAREMIRQNQTDGGGGRIINIASIAGRGYPGTSNAAHAASKGAVIALADQDRGATARPAQHQRQCDLSRGHPNGTWGAQRPDARRRARHHRRPAPGRAGSGDPARARQRARGHRGDGGISRFPRRAEHHRPGL
jgi:NAD(P)-dependent dehydrogenase (short-subunit alcohol dehydrogenase family)